MIDMEFSAAVITVSDKGWRGERKDTSGPALVDMLTGAGWYVAYTAIVPDEKDMIQRELTACSDEKKLALVLTTGGTGFSPRDVTPEATAEVVERLCPGIPEAMRAESMKITPHGCLSRETAGIRGTTLIINLPGSRKASTENLSAVLPAIRHGVEIIWSSGSADCAVPEVKKAVKPSVDQWLSEAKSGAEAGSVGMYLVHNGVVRATARSRVRQGDETAEPVTGMLFSCDQQKLQKAVEEAKKLDGVYYVRAWVNEGRLRVGDDIMQVLIGADIRPHAVQALEKLVGTIKTTCVTEKELYGE
ncbi:MAG: molybdenum cofactor biosynthesis protein MoaE [Clostridia bacterium]|nr:molybdenum cofactor biosynthesis protein MoaE [Clostridia bacterium]